MQDIKENIKKVFESKKSVKFLYIVGIVIIAMVIFHVGVIVGFHKASFGRSWGENYERNFGRGEGRGASMMDDIGKMGMMGYFPNAHGAIGKIIKIESPTIIVLGSDNKEKVVLISTDTEIEKVEDHLTITDLKTSDFVTVIGSPNASGQIEAKLIRVLPNPELLNTNPSDQNANKTQ